MIDLKLIHACEEKEQLNFTIYKTIKKELEALCKAENIKMSHLIRHLINVFLEERRKNASV